MDDRSFLAAQAFVLDCKKFWTTRIYPTLKTEYQTAAARRTTPVESPAEVAEMIADTPLYRYFAWLERHLQRLKYSGRYGLVPYHRERRDKLRRPLEAARDNLVKAGALHIDADFKRPRYYEAVDIHQHPGGVWRDDIAAFVYERGARSTTPLLGGRHRDLHQRLTDLVGAAGTPRRILDMGCGFGKSTRPFYETFPDAEIEAIDLSAHCLELAAFDASAAQARNVKFRQMDACKTTFADGSFDLITSTMLIHEMPPATIEALFDEAARLLAPGGRMVHLDFYALPDAFARFIHYGHGRRNNEPFMEPWAEMNLAGILAARGFRDIRVDPFAESEGVDTADSIAWRFPWTTIAARR